MDFIELGAIGERVGRAALRVRHGLGVGDDSGHGLGCEIGTKPGERRRKAGEPPALT